MKSIDLKNQQGFSLLETTVAMMVVVSLIGLSATLYNNHMNSLNIKKSAEVLRIASDSYFRYLNSSKSKLADICHSLSQRQGSAMYEDIYVSLAGQEDSCRLSLQHPAQSKELKGFLPEGMIFPSDLPSGDALTGYGKVVMRNGQPEVTSLLIAGLQLGQGQERKKNIFLSKMAAEYGSGFGYVDRRNGISSIKGDGGLFSMPGIIDLIDGSLKGAELPAGTFFALNGDSNSNDNEGYLTQAEADERYLVRTKIPNHPELNRMKTDIELGNNSVKAESQNGTLGVNGGDNRIEIHGNNKGDYSSLLTNSLQFSQGSNTLSLTGRPDGFNFNSAVNVEGQMEATSVLTPSLSMPGNKGVVEGDYCSAEKEGQIIKSSKGNYLVCKFLPDNTGVLYTHDGYYTNGNISLLACNVEHHTCDIILDSKGRYSWVYLYPDLVNEIHLMMFWQDSDHVKNGNSVVDIFEDSDQLHWLIKTFSLPEWYPYGAVEVCAYTSAGGRTWAMTSIFRGKSLPIDMRKYLPTLVGKAPWTLEYALHDGTDLGPKYQYNIHCSTLQPGEMYSDFVDIPHQKHDLIDDKWFNWINGFGTNDFPFAVVIRYKGNRPLNMMPRTIPLHGLLPDA